MPDACAAEQLQLSGNQQSQVVVSTTQSDQSPVPEDGNELIGEYQNLMANVKKATAQEDVANRPLERATALVKVEAISPREFELRKAEYEQAKVEVESSRAEAAKAEEKLHRFGLNDEEIPNLMGSGMTQVHRTASNSVLRAPFGGVVTQYDVSRGEVVDKQKELFTIVDTGTVWALAVAGGFQLPTTLS